MEQSVGVRASLSAPSILTLRTFMTIFSFIIGMLIVCSTIFIGLATFIVFIAIFMEKEKRLFTVATLICAVLFITCLNLYSEPAIQTTTTVDPSNIVTTTSSYRGTTSTTALDTSTGAIYSISTDNLLKLQNCKSTTGLGVYTTQSWKWGPITLKDYDPTNQLQITCN